MQLDPPVPLSSIEGGTAQFLAGFHASQVAAAIAQNRLQETLDAIGAPGKWACDPQAGTLQLRGTTFAAEMLGSFGETEWLWAWANPFLAIPESKTTLSRAARDAYIAPMFAVPFVDLEDAGGPHQIAMQVIGAGFGAAYYICQFPGSQVVYALKDELAAQWPKLYELQRAITTVLATGMQDAVAAITMGADYLGLSADRTATQLVVRDGNDHLVAHLIGDSVTKIDSSVKL
jgi:hypothetical protein